MSQLPSSCPDSANFEASIRTSRWKLSLSKRETVNRSFNFEKIGRRKHDTSEGQLALSWFYVSVKRVGPSQCRLAREIVALRTVSSKLANALLEACRWCVWHPHSSCPSQQYRKEEDKRSSAFLRARSDLEQGRRRLLNVPVAVGMDFKQEKFLPDPQTREEERDYSRSRTRWPYSLKSQRLIMISVICLVLIGTYLLST